MNRTSTSLLVSLAFLMMMPACSRRVGSAVQSEGISGPTANAPASSPAVTSEPLPVETIPPVPSPSQVPKQAAMGIPGKAMHLQDAFFEYDRALLRPEVAARLQADAKMLKEHPEMKTTIEGHCDERGSAEYNLALGNRRAEAVKRYLINLGVPASQLSTVSYGKEKPFCSEHTEACYRENRRAHFAGPGAEN